MEFKKIIVIMVMINLIGINWLCSGTKSGEIIELQGRANIIRADNSEEQAVKGSIIEEGDKIKTFFASTAKVKLIDESVIDIKAGTTMDFKDVKVSSDGEKKVKLNLWFGKSKVSVQKLKSLNSTFEVKTPAAVCGVRGTDFGLGVDPSKTTSIAVFSGVVSVKNAAGEVQVQQNQSTVVKPNQAPSTPTAMKSNEREEWDVKEGSKKEETGGEDIKAGELLKIMGDFPHFTNKRSLKIRGTIKLGAKLKINDEDVPVIGTSFNKDIMLVDGLNKIKITGITADGKKQEIIKEVILDAIPPSFLQIVKPVNFDFGGVYNKKYLAIIGFTDKDNKVKVDNKPVEIDGRGQFKINLPLQNGENHIKIEVEDEAGNLYTRYSGPFVVDFEPPTVNITSPAEGKVFATSLVSVTGITEAAAKVTIRVNGIEKVSNKVYPSGNISENLTISEEGSYIIAVQAVDLSGNMSPQVQRHIRVDLTPPLLEITKNEVQGNNLVITVKSNERLIRGTLTVTGVSSIFDLPAPTVSSTGYYYTWSISLLTIPHSAAVSFAGHNEANLSNQVSGSLSY